jgi:hypothetical protein
MNSSKILTLAAALCVVPFSLTARDIPPKPEVYVPMKQMMTSMMDYQINKLDRAVKLSDQQKADLRAVLTEEAAELGKLQKEHRGDMSFTIPGTIEIVTDTNASILAIVTPAQKAAAVALVEERKAAFNNRLKMIVEELWTHQERMKKIPVAMDPAAAKP